MSVGCNSQCRYCYKKSFDECYDASETGLNDSFKWDFDAPNTFDLNVNDLKRFLENKNDCEKHVLTFYGGEPLLHIDKIKEIMDKIDARFMIQTNAKLLNQLPKEYTNRMEVILISLDGTKELTDFNRGIGTYDLVKKNIQLIKNNGFKGEIIARMVVDEFSLGKEGIPGHIKHLLKIGFDSVHWQMDAGFYSHDYKQRDFKEFVKEYDNQIDILLDYWVERMKKGEVLKLYPFLGIFESLYYGKKEKLRCGSGYANYTITTNGKIGSCPIMHDATNFQVGDIWNNEPNKLNEIYVGEPCTSCDILDLCGGRCLYANKAKLWPKEGQDLICLTVRHLIDSIKQRMPQIKELIEKGKITEKDFEYEKYTGPEIIP
jgi:putative peptide-modifying radical SAM enzyme